MKKILVIDDDESILEALQIAIEGEGYEVVTLLDGEKTVETAKTFCPDLIIMDLLLSGRNGSELVRELKKSSETKDIPVLMLSAHPSASRTAMDTGVNEFIPKPFDMYQLLESIRRYAY